MTEARGRASPRSRRSLRTARCACARGRRAPRPRRCGRGPASLSRPTSTSASGFAFRLSDQAGTFALPALVLITTTLLAVGEVDDRRGALLARLAPGGGQQQDRRAADLAADAPAAEPVERRVQLAGPTQARGAEGVRERGSRGGRSARPRVSRRRVESMAEPHPFRRAAEAKDVELMTETLREDVVLHSPILFRGFEGREMVGRCSPTSPPRSRTSPTSTKLVERGHRRPALQGPKVGDRELEGIDFLDARRGRPGRRADRLHAPDVGPHRLQRADGRAPGRRAAGARPRA